MEWDERQSGEKTRFPKIKIEDESLFLALRLAKNGYYGGDPKKVLEADADMVLSVLEFEKYEDEYLRCYQQLNRPD